MTKENLEQNNPPENIDEPLDLESAANDEQDEAARLKEENTRLKDQMLRALADAENTRRRAERDVEEAGKYSIVSFARDLIEVIENLDRAEQNLPKELIESNPQLQNFYQGIEMTKKNLLGAFEKHGIRRLNPIGEKFDHNFQQAVAQVPSLDKEPGTVISVVQAGYIIKDRLLRPAMVAVAKEIEQPGPLDTSA